MGHRPSPSPGPSRIHRPRANHLLTRRDFYHRSQTLARFCASLIARNNLRSPAAGNNRAGEGTFFKGDRNKIRNRTVLREIPTLPARISWLDPSDFHSWMRSYRNRSLKWTKTLISLSNTLQQTVETGAAITFAYLTKGKVKRLGVQIPHGIDRIFAMPCFSHRKHSWSISNIGKINSSS